MSQLVTFLENPAKQWAIDPNAEELTVILLGRDWGWPGFDVWHQRFQSARYFPDSWKGLEYIPDPPQPETTERLATFASLSDTAKRLLIRMGALTRKSPQVVSPYDVTRKTDLSPNALESAMQEMQSVGSGTMNLPLADRLAELKKDQLVGIADKHNVASGGTKAEIGERLEAGVDREALLQELPPDKRQELWGIESLFGDLDVPFVEFELRRIRLLAWDIRTLISTLSRVYEATKWDNADLVVWANGECPVCKQHTEERISLQQVGGASVDLPPYHPGCDCEIRTDYEMATKTLHVELDPTELQGRSGGRQGKTAASGCGSLVALACLALLVAIALSLVQ